MPLRHLKPFWQTTDSCTARLFHGDVLATLKRLPSQSAHCCVCSPPYWGLRSYLEDGHKQKVLELGSERLPDCKQLLEVGPGLYRKSNCAERDWTSACHVCRMVLVFRELRRVLRDDGVFFLNYGDSYASGEVGRHDQLQSAGHCAGEAGVSLKKLVETERKKGPKSGLPSGNLVGIPWRVALALQADGWILRQDIIWHKLSPMPESVQNRCTKSHEYLFLFAKKQGYYYDADAVRERTGDESTDEEYTAKLADNAVEGNTDWYQRQQSRIVNGGKSGRQKGSLTHPGGRNKRSVWSFAAEAYSGAHFAIFPKKLVEPCIKAGTSAHGCCAACGTPWRRVTRKTQLKRDRPRDYVKRTGEAGTGNSCANTVAGVAVETLGWEPGCECYGKFVKRLGKRLGYGSYHDHKEDGVAYGLRQGGKGPASDPGLPTKEFDTTITEYVSDLPLAEHPVKPCIILDPFAGSFTTGVVALELGRQCWGIELSEKYLLENAIPRIEGLLLAKPTTVGLVPRPAPERLELGKPAKQRKTL